MLLEDLKDFCQETSIHGLAQIANTRTSGVKRVLWFLMFLGSLAYAGQQLVSSISSKSNINVDGVFQFAFCIK